MKFPGLLILLPPKNPLEPPWGGVGQICLSESQSHIYPNMCAKFGRGLTVVSKKNGGVQTPRQRDTAACFSR